MKAGLVKYGVPTEFTLSRQNWPSAWVKFLLLASKGHGLRPNISTVLRDYDMLLNNVRGVIAAKSADIPILRDAAHFAPPEAFYMVDMVSSIYGND